MKLQCSTEEGRWEVECTTRQAPIVKKVNGSRFVQRVWTIPASFLTAYELQYHADRSGVKLNISDEVLGQFAEMSADFAQRQERVELQDGEVLFKHQAEAVDWLLKTKRGILGDDMGLGKTLSSLTALSLVDSDLALVICPSGLMHEWAKQIEKYTDFSYVLVEGSAVKRRKLLEDHDVDIHVVGYGVVTKHAAVRGRVKASAADKEPGLLNFNPYDTVIIDECHRAKNNTAKVSHAIWHLTEDVERVWGLTGTPISNNVSEFYGMLRIVWAKLFSSKSKYIDTWLDARPGYWGGLEIDGVHTDHLGMWDRLVAATILRRQQDEVLSLPEIVRSRYVLSMTPKQKRQYKAAVKDPVLEIDEQQILLDGPLKRWQMMTAIAQGELISDGEEVVPNYKRKISELLGILESLDCAVVMATRLYTVEAVKVALEGAGYKVGVVIGDTENPHQVVEDFQAGKLDVVVGTVGALSEGYTLTRSRALIFMDRSYRLDQNQQAEGRIRRIGSDHNSVLYIDIVTEDTVDELPIEALIDKADHVKDVLNDPIRLLQKLGIE